MQLRHRDTGGRTLSVAVGGVWRAIKTGPYGPGKNYFTNLMQTG